MTDPAREAAPADASPAGAAPVVRARVAVTLGRAGGRRAELVTFDGLPDGDEHVACLIAPEPSAPADGPAPLVRLHSECLTGDVFGSARCDCGPQLDEALERVAAEGGAVVYLRQEGRGIGLYNKLDAYLLQDQDFDTFEANRRLGRGADERDYAAGAAILRALGLTRVRLLTNNPDKVRQLRALGIEVADVVPTAVHLTGENLRYLQAKARIAGHLLGGVAGGSGGQADRAGQAGPSGQVGQTGQADGADHADRADHPGQADRAGRALPAGTREGQPWT